MKILCIDSNSILNRAYYGIRPLTTKEGVHTNAIFGFLNILMKLCDDVKPDYLACAFDLRAPTFRHKRYDGYKAQRKGMPEELAEQMPIIRELLPILGYKIIDMEGYEADDILGTLSDCCEGTEHHCYIATGDRDSLQLVSKNTTVLLSTSKGGKSETIICDPAYINEKYGVTSQELIQVKALMGDASDNIPGVAGIGEKTALKLVMENKTLDYIYDNIDEINITKGVRSKLESDKENAYLSLELAEIYRKVPIDRNLESYNISQVDNNKAYQMLTKLEMNKFIKKLGIIEGEIDKVGNTLEENKTYNLIEGSKIDFKQICGMESIFIHASKNLERGIIVYKNDVYVFYTDVEKILRTVLESEVKKITYDCKDMYHIALENNIEIKNIVMDISISAYLLNPNSASYGIDLLLGQYEIPQVIINGQLSLTHIQQDLFNQEIPDDTNEKELEEIKNICRCVSLADELKAEIEQKEMCNLLNEIEIPLAEVLSAMEIEGFSIDSEGLLEFGSGIGEEIKSLEQIIYEKADEIFNINSPKQLGVILFEKLGLPAKKKTKTGYSTGAEVLEELKGKHPIIEYILSYRTLTKLKSTYIDGLYKVVGKDGRIHSHFRQTETRTGRISSTEPNMQNIPIRTELGRNLRKFFCASDDNILVDADYSQIELRVLAHIANDGNMIDSFLADEDIHQQTAAQIFDLPPLFVTSEMRSKAKAVNFGIIYGIGAFSLSNDIGVSVSQADEYIKNYLNKFKGVKEYMTKTIDFAKENGYSKTEFNRRRPLPEISSSNHNLRKFGERVAMNMPIQGTAADIIKIAMVKVYHRLKSEGLKSRLILQVHDELIVEATPDEVDIVSLLLKQEMENAVDFKVKLKVDLNVGKTWFESK